MLSIQYVRQGCESHSLAVPALSLAYSLSGARLAALLSNTLFCNLGKTDHVALHRYHQDSIELHFVAGSESLLDLPDSGEDPCPTAGRFRDSPVVDICFSKGGQVPSGVFCSPLDAAF